MTDLDQLLRADARDWRSTQTTDLDLDAALQRSVHGGTGRARRPRALAAAAAAAAVAAAAVTLAVHQHQGRPSHHGSATPAAPVSSPPPSSAPVTTPVTTPRLSGLGRPEPGQRTLLTASGTTEQAADVAATSGPESVYAACIGGGSITVVVPGRVSFSVVCDGTATGGQFPGGGRSLLITGVRHQHWHVAVFGR